MMKFSFLLVLFLISSGEYYVKAQNSLFETIFNPFGINWNRFAPTRTNQNEQGTSTPNNPCPSVFEYVNDENITEGEIKLKTSGRDAVVNLVFEANVRGSITSIK